MFVLAIAVAVALLIPLLTRGSYTRLFSTRWYWVGFLLAGVGIQLFLEFDSLPRARWDDVGIGLLIASYVCILLFCGRNLVRRGMGIVMIGVACNALVISINTGMPVKLRPEWRNKSWAQPTVKHHPRTSSDKLVFLSDIIVLNRPFEDVLSFGDLILAVGLCDVAYHASRRRKRRGLATTSDEATAPEAIAAPAADVDLTTVELGPQLDITDEPARVVEMASVAGDGSRDLPVPHDAVEGSDDARVVYVRRG